MIAHFIPAISAPLGRTEAAYWFAFSGPRLLCDERSPDLIPLLVDFAELGLETIRQQYLGTLDGRPCYSVELAPEPTLPEGMDLKGLRAVYPNLAEGLFTVAGRAIQIVDWDRTHQYCGRCGAETVSLDSERAKKCPQCELVNYPRLSPAIIVRVSRGRELLLARAARWPTGMYSVLAGFVEPGETLEQAVEREVMEEVGLEIKNISYFGSQPWPFPNSLMVGFTAEYAGGEIQLEVAELVDAGWYTPGNLPGIPPKISIARRLIDSFVEGQSNHGCIEY